MAARAHMRWNTCVTTTRAGVLAACVLPERLALRRELDRLDSQLQQLIERGEDDDVVVERFSARVEEVRARRNVRRTLILLEMYRILTPGQRLGLSSLRAAAPR